ncbi:MAG: mechanosensitive ion channel family protein [Caulobacteraceae bacterium]|nr:mechanosensitive ion channel family protein [Caulobacteraceae bacterium]
MPSSTFPILTALAAAPTGPTPVQIARARIEAALSGDPEVWRNFATAIGLFATNLVMAALILALTLWASGWAAGLVRRAIERLPGRRGGDTTLQSFSASLTRWTVIVVGLVAVLQQLGVQTTSILAVLGAASLAVGLALQGALSNVAAGVMILILRPYRVGDVVEINGRSGTVKALDLFGTQLSDADNLDVFVPNGKVFGEVIINYSTPGNRRMELNFHIDYADDLDRAMQVLLACAQVDPRILPEPAPNAKVTALGENAVIVALHAWAPTACYWDVRFDLLKRAKQTLDTAGMRVAYPHQVAVEKVRPAPNGSPSGGAVSEAD